MQQVKVFGEEECKLVHAEAGLDPGASAGLFIGVQKYRDECLNPVQFAVDDAVDLAWLFGFTLKLISPSKIILALSGQPEKETSKRALSELVVAGAKRTSATLFDLYKLVYVAGMNTSKSGIYVVSFAGHGFNDQGSSLLCPEDLLYRRFVRTGLDLTAIKDDIDSAPAERRLVLVDACRGKVARSRATAMDGPPANEAFLKAFSSVRGLATLFATSRGGHSYDDPVRQNGVFTSLVLDGLHGGAAIPGNQFITLKDLSVYTHAKIRNWIMMNREKQIETSRGVHLSCESVEMMRLPLAVNMEAFQASVNMKTRCEAAVERLKAEIEPPITGKLFDQIRSWLGKAPPGELAGELLQEIEKLDGTISMRRAIVFFVAQHLEDFGVGRFEPPVGDSASSSKVGVKSMLTAEARREGILTKARDFPESKARQLGGQWRDSSPETAPRSVPAWASAGGSDDYGLWADFVVGEVAQRMRWIEPGVFVMGSSEDEVGHCGNESPQREVEILEGFWLADTPCTQQLWIQVMKRNGCRFRSPRRPTENIVWNDTQVFLARLSAHYPEFFFCLPTEAQWEYACRAGTSAGTYAGDLEIVGINNAPALDGIAWYAGNSGRFFELSDGENVSNWPGMQYPTLQAGTRSVAEKDPNSWGLFDMLGNVWEWCQDEWSEQYGSTSRSADGLLRSIRGGSWASNPASVRAASRNSRLGSTRCFDLGFRFAIASTRASRTKA